ncbi:MAG: hypothetical protein CND85_00105 [Marine Group II euryarchaeote MED-G33]|nr:MAG: hypothetical protein CND85_00105 [Marine Group II euryarchaeote MED-G33]
MAEDFTSLLIAVGILLIPVILALPLRFWWTYRVGNEPEHVRYRRWVRQVLDAGEPLATRRQELDHLARGLPIDASRQGRIEMDVLHPLKLPHFMLLPVLILSPLVGLIGAIIFVLLFPLILAAEWLLIDRGILAKVVNIVMRIMHWGIIGIHRLDNGVRDEDAMVEHMHRLPTTAFLGLFCYLIVSYMPLPTWVGISFTVLLFLILTSIIVIVKAASHGELVFADTSQRRMQPMERLVDDILAPVVGLGLLFLLSRQLFLTQIGSSSSIFSDPIWFAGIVLIVLYSAAAVAIMVEISFFGLRSERVRMVFQNQMVESHNPVLYAFTREHDRMELNPLRSLKDHLESNGEGLEKSDTFDFEDMLRTPSTLQEGEDATPPQKPDLEKFETA